MNLTLRVHRDPQLYPISCSSDPSCDKMFASIASETEHRRNRRCIVFLCEKCGEKTKDKNTMNNHMKICDIYYTDNNDEMLAESVFDPNGAMVNIDCDGMENVVNFGEF